ncbi:hypothetical protein Salat_1534400 [Sesamum alatum]|uniref:Uncharacterized protein n=1 Tax=Sesamum alatum TaxID=300844 RepID=A0AAE2CMT3_9LAMI|nr:hypothetical protein Salat_1534400 [Sesamum alatum]
MAGKKGKFKKKKVKEVTVSGNKDTAHLIVDKTKKCFTSVMVTTACETVPSVESWTFFVAEADDDDEVMAMIDTGATHNFVAEREIQKLGCLSTQHCSRIKVVNSEARPIQGVASVELTVGT